MFGIIRTLFFTPGPFFTWRRVTLVLLFSTLAVSGSALIGVLCYRYAVRQHILYASGTIGAIVHTTHQVDGPCIPLQTTFFSEILSLSVDAPTKLAQFDLEVAKQRLLNTHILKEVRLKKMKPNILWISYVARVPIAFLGDYTNTGIDEEGVVFPYAPFYPPRNLPRIFLGQRWSHPWGEKISCGDLSLIKAITRSLADEKIEQIDFSKTDENSSGRREIIVVLNSRVLRLPTENTLQQLANYSILKKSCLKGSESVIDLRLPDVAYILQK